MLNFSSLADLVLSLSSIFHVTFASRNSRYPCVLKMLFVYRLHFVVNLVVFGVFYNSLTAL